MMDLKEIIKWFIPCFHIFPLKKRKMDSLLTLVCLFLFFNSCAGMANMGVSENVVGSTKNLGLNFNNNDEQNSLIYQSEKIADDNSGSLKSTSMGNISVGRTFGRPFFKKIIGGLIPLVFQIGMASTWAVVAALVGVKTLVVTLIILKLLLVAGAAKIGALFASKGHHHAEHHGWEQPPAHQKEIHLHIHNGQIGHQEHHEEHVPISSWSRDGYPVAADTKNINIAFDPYRGGPQTISTPFGNYVKIEPTINQNT